MTRIDRIKLDMRESHEILKFYKNLQPYFEINLALDTNDNLEPSNYHTSSRLEEFNIAYWHFQQEIIKACNSIPEENYCYCKECNPIIGTPVEGEQYEVTHEEIWDKIKEGYKIPPRECKFCSLDNKTGLYNLCDAHKNYFPS